MAAFVNWGSVLVGVLCNKSPTVGGLSWGP